MDVNGRVNIDSTLIVKDSLTIQSDLRVEEDAHFMNKTEMQDADVNLLFRANGESEFNGDVRFTNFNSAITLQDKYFMMLDSTGNATRIPFEPFFYEMQKILGNDSLLLKNIGKEQALCGPAIPTAYMLNPYWRSNPYKLTVPCSDVNVGIGTSNPNVNLDVRGTTYSGRLALGFNDGINQSANLFFHLKTSSTTPYTSNVTVFKIENSTRPIFQINNDGIVRAREVILNLDQAWPDYVFKSNYNLTSFGDLRKYIQTNGHLPNVPSASEVAANGVGVGEMNKILLEKVEELTLYILELEKRLSSVENTPKD